MAAVNHLTIEAVGFQTRSDQTTELRWTEVLEEFKNSDILRVSRAIFSKGSANIKHFLDELNEPKVPPKCGIFYYFKKNHKMLAVLGIEILIYFEFL